MVMSSTETSHNFTLTSSSSTLRPWRGNWALQLWACDQPHTSGPLVGVKIAEAALNGSLDSSESARRLAAEAQAHVPGGQRDYAMVLVLASGDAGHYTQVHDFANYPARQQFVTPHLDGRVGYRINGDDVVLEAERIRQSAGQRQHQRIAQPGALGAGRSVSRRDRRRSRARARRSWTTGRTDVSRCGGRARSVLAPARGQLGDRADAARMGGSRRLRHARLRSLRS